MDDPQQQSEKLDLDSITAPPSPEGRDDVEAQQESEFYRDNKAEVEVSGLRQDLTERKKYAGRIFHLICWWLGAVLVLVCLQGFGGVYTVTFKLSDSILLALIGTTTLNVVGILYVVAHYLFPNRGLKP